MIDRLPARHVHLDFHTSEHIPGVGSRFSKKQFQRALRLGRLNHITVFAKCHHSWSYYPTKVGRKHPTLKIDLMGQQIDACREIGVRVPIYYTVGWSATDAAMHPEWRCKKKDGEDQAANLNPHAGADDPRPTCSWYYLCPNNPEYRRLMVEQTREICENYHVDGFFYDICHLQSCYCDTCRAGMKADGVNAGDDKAATDWYTSRWVSFMRECHAVIRERHPEASVFFNGRANLDTPEAILAQQTHYELEDLPTTWGGYDKFPLRAKFFAAHSPEKATLAMSGKFHTMWGEFGGFKHPDAMKFEAAAMIAWGAACSFGDQCHPDGEMDLETYRWLGEAFRYVEKIEEFGLASGSRPHANLGLYLCRQTAHDQGTANILLESQQDFEVVLPESDFSRYETIILPGGRCLDAAAARKLSEYVARGGSLLVQAESALDAEGKRFVLDVGAKYLGPARFKLDYLVAGGELGKGLVASPFLCYASALRAKPSRGARVLARVMEPYFDRTYSRFCSHQNTPNQLKPAAHAGAVQQGRVIYLAHAVGAMYHSHGARLHRDLLMNALRRLHKRPTLAVKMPSAGRVNLVHQPEQRRYVAHLLYGTPHQRGLAAVIEDLVPLYDVPVELRVKEKIKRVTLPLEKKKLGVKASQGAVRVTVPEVRCHQVVTFEY
jgi:hypothetical protein